MERCAATVHRAPKHYLKGIQLDKTFGLRAADARMDDAQKLAKPKGGGQAVPPPRHTAPDGAGGFGGFATQLNRAEPGGEVGFIGFAAELNALQNDLSQEGLASTPTPNPSLTLTLTLTLTPTLTLTLT